MAKKEKKRYATSVWFDETTRAELDLLMERSGENQSEVIKTLIHAAVTDGREGEIRRLVSELHRIVM